MEKDIVITTDSKVIEPLTKEKDAIKGNLFTIVIANADCDMPFDADPLDWAWNYTAASARGVYTSYESACAALETVAHDFMKELAEEREDFDIDYEFHRDRVVMCYDESAMCTFSVCQLNSNT